MIGDLVQDSARSSDTQDTVRTMFYFVVAILVFIVSLLVALGGTFGLKEEKKRPPAPTWGDVFDGFKRQQREIDDHVVAQQVMVFAWMITVASAIAIVVSAATLWGS